MNFLPSNYSAVSSPSLSSISMPCRQLCVCSRLCRSERKITMVLGTKLLSSSAPAVEHHELPLPHFSGVLDHSGCYHLQQLPWTTRANPSSPWDCYSFPSSSDSHLTGSSLCFDERNCFELLVLPASLGGHQTSLNFTQSGK